MYQVSEAYREAIIKKHRKYKIEGTITLKNGAVIPFADKDISEGSLSIDNQCVNGEAFEFGSVFSGQLSMSIRSGIDRYSLYDGVIQLSFFMQTTSDVWEEIPLGVYNINEPTRKGDYISIKALDNMVLLDIDFTDKASFGKAWDILGLVAELTGIELGMTQEYVEALPNGISNLRVPATFQMDSMRDLVSYLASALGCFAAMDRQGRLVLVQFKKEPVLTIEPGFRTSSEFADFAVKYTAIQTAIRGSIKSAALEQDDGMTLTIEENPFFQVEDETILNYLLNSILNEAAGIQYIPSTISLYGDPSIDLGDMILYRLSDGTEIRSIITNANFKYRAVQTIKSVGKNPRLARAKTKSEKNLDKISSQIGTKDVVFYSFINARDLSITTKDSVVAIDFTTQEGRLAEFKASILLSAASVSDALTKVKAIYYLDKVELTTYYPVETYTDGSHILVLYYPFTGLQTNHVHQVEVFLEVTDGTVTIGKGQAIASISGQGLAAGRSEWDGTLEFEENISLFAPEIGFVGFTEELDVIETTPHEQAITESIGLFTPTINFVGFTAEISDEIVIRSNTINTFTSESQYVISDEESVRFQTAYTRISTSGIIDSGYLEELDLKSEWRRIDNVDIAVKSITK